MEAGGGGVRPGPDPFLRAEIVHCSERTRITRLFLPGRTVIRKEPLGPDAEGRVRHEAAMLDRLRGVAGVAQLAEAPRYPGSVMLEDAGEASLAGVTGPLPAGELAGLGLGVARAVAGMHRRGVVHRDIAPANVVVSGEGLACLVDFALASSFAEIRPEFTHYAEITGTLAYLAPEATGRTGRPLSRWTTPRCTPSTAGSPASRRHSDGSQRWSPGRRRRGRCSPRSPRKSVGCSRPTSRS
jgi:hypothetical protein